jgi:plasmid stabilization system protein ParE
MVNNTESEPTQYKIRFTERAARDIDAITVWFSEAVSDAVAIAWRVELYEKIATLAIFPHRCPIVREKFRSEVRQMLFRRTGSEVSHRILFTVDSEVEATWDSPTVLIMAVLYSGRKALTAVEIRELEA